jgi:hypothetical protein
MSEGWHRLRAAAAVAVLLLLCAALPACDNRPSADGQANGNGGRGHVKVGFPF